MRRLVASVGVMTVLIGAGIGVASSPAKPPVAASRAAPKFHAPAGVVDLGKLKTPTATLAGRVYDLAPGGTLRLVVGETDSKGLGEIATLPRSILSVRRTVLGRPAPIIAGKQPKKVPTEVEYRFTLPATAKPGRYEVRALGRSPQSAVAFAIRVPPQRFGEPRPL